jgi:mersacidin/lichenicidin family type 2 lantibiotic
MSQVNVIRAWKDESYRLSLTEGERAALPEHPAGLVEMAEPDQQEAAGGWFPTTVLQITQYWSCANNTDNPCYWTCF